MELHEVIMMMMLYATAWFCFHEKQGIEDNSFKK